MNYIEITHKMANGNTVYVRVRYHGNTFIVDSVGIKYKRKRTIVWLDQCIRDDYVCRRLDFKGRIKFEIDAYVRAVGAQVLNDSLQAAWLQSKPERIEEAQ